MAFGIKKKEQTPGYPYWIIVDRTLGKEKVWIGARDSSIFSTEAEAVREFNFQRAAMKPGMKTGYRVERVDAPGGAAAAREGAKRAEVDSMEEMARGEVRMPHADN